MVHTMGRKKMSDSAPAGVKTKADAVRAAQAQGIESPKAISEFVKTTYGMDITAATVSAYKSADKAKGKKKTPRNKTTGSESHGFVAGEGLFSHLEAVKVLVKQLGADQVKRMVDLFA